MQRAWPRYTETIVSYGVRGVREDELYYYARACKIRFFDEVFFFSTLLVIGRRAVSSFSTRCIYEVY